MRHISRGGSLLLSFPFLFFFSFCNSVPRAPKKTRPVYRQIEIVNTHVHALRKKLRRKLKLNWLRAKPREKNLFHCSRARHNRTELKNAGKYVLPVLFHPTLYHFHRETSVFQPSIWSSSLTCDAQIQRVIQLQSCCDSAKPFPRMQMQNPPTELTRTAERSQINNVRAGRFRSQVTGGERTMHVFIGEGGRSRWRRTKGKRRCIVADKTKCFGPGKEEEEAGGYNGYLYYRREKAKSRRGGKSASKVVVVSRYATNVAFRSGWPTELRSNWSTPPRLHPIPT